jgi:hypothetical protein
MALAKPVIATGYSGNLDFMKSDTAYLVPWKPTSVPAGCDPYPVGAIWADPDLDAAALLMRHVALHREEATEKGRRGRQSVRDEHGIDQAVAFVRQRFEEVQRERSRNAAPTGKPTAPRPSSPVRAVARPVIRRIRQRLDNHPRSESKAVANAFAPHTAAHGRG